jgi:hypothetical protein
MGGGIFDGINGMDGMGSDKKGLVVRAIRKRLV